MKCGTYTLIIKVRVRVSLNQTAAGTLDDSVNCKVVCLMCTIYVTKTHVFCTINTSVCSLPCQFSVLYNTESLITSVAVSCV